VFVFYDHKCFPRNAKKKIVGYLISILLLKLWCFNFSVLGL